MVVPSNENNKNKPVATKVRFFAYFFLLVGMFGHLTFYGFNFEITFWVLIFAIGLLLSMVEMRLKYNSKSLNSKILRLDDE